MRLLEPLEDVAQAWQGDELLLLDRARARLHRLNASAAIVWGELGAHRSLADVVEAVATTVGLHAAEVRADVELAIGTMRDAGLLADGSRSAGDLGASVATLRAEAEALGLELPAGHLLLHGGAASLDGRAVAFVGPSGAGKSTATAALVHAGWAFLGDEVVVVGSGRTVVAHHRPIELTTRSVELVGPPAGSVLDGPGAKRRVDSAMLAGGRAMSGTLVAILLPVHAIDEPDAVGVRRLDPVEAIEALAGASFNVVDLEDGLEQLVALVDAVPVLAVHTSPLDQLAGTVADLIARHRAPRSG